MPHSEYSKLVNKLSAEVERTKVSQDRAEEGKKIEWGMRNYQEKFRMKQQEEAEKKYQMYKGTTPRFDPRTGKPFTLNLPNNLLDSLPGTLLKSLGPDTKDMASAGGPLNNSSEMTYNLNLTINEKEQLKATHVLNGAKQKYLANNNLTFRIGG